MTNWYAVCLLGAGQLAAATDWTLGSVGFGDNVPERDGVAIFNMNPRVTAVAGCDTDLWISSGEEPSPLDQQCKDCKVEWFKVINGVPYPVDPAGNDPHYFTAIEPGADDDITEGTSSGFYAHLKIRNTLTSDAGIYMTKVTLSKYDLDEFSYVKGNFVAKQRAENSVGYVYHKVEVTDKLPCPFKGSQQNSLGPIVTGERKTETFKDFEVAAQGPFKFSRKTYGNSARFKVTKLAFDIKVTPAADRGGENQIDRDFDGVPKGSNFQILVLTPNMTTTDSNGGVTMFVKQRQSLHVQMKPGAQLIDIREQAGLGPLLVGYNDYVAFSYTTCYWSIHHQTAQDNPPYQQSMIVEMDWQNGYFNHPFPAINGGILYMTKNANTPGTSLNMIKSPEALSLRATMEYYDGGPPPPAKIVVPEPEADIGFLVFLIFMITTLVCCCLCCFIFQRQQKASQERKNFMLSMIGQSSNVSSETGEPLPPNWFEETTKDGNIYYYNPVSGESMWDIPTME